MHRYTNVLDAINTVLGWGLSDESYPEAISHHAGHMAGWDTEDVYCFDHDCAIH
jgi:hypothetical protein